MPAYQAPLNGSKISLAYAEAMASALLTRVMLETYELRHASFTTGPIRFVNDFVDVTARLEIGAPVDSNTMVTFTACPVRSEGPEQGDTSDIPSINLTIDGVSGLLAQQLDLALASGTPVFVTQRIYSSDDLEGPARLPVITMLLRNVHIGDVTVSAAASFYDPSNNTFPRKEYTAAEYPGLSP